MTSWQTRVVALVLQATARPAFATRQRGLRTLTRGAEPAPPPKALRARVTRLDLGEQGRYAVDRVDPQASALGQDGVAVVYLHGGAFVNGITSHHWDLVGELADASGAPVHVPHYGRAPQHTADEVGGLVDALVAHLTRRGPVRLHLAGDSAGGCLALLAAQRLRDRGHGPSATVTGVSLVSPALDLTLTNPRIPEVERTDPWLTRAGTRPLLEAWAGERALDDPEVSPLLGDLSGLPPLEVFSGTRDICWPDAELLVERARAAGTEVTHHVAQGSPHVPVLLPTPEGRRLRAALVATVAALAPRVSLAPLAPRDSEPAR